MIRHSIQLAYIEFATATSVIDLVEISKSSRHASACYHALALDVYIALLLEV
jgi:hypothetical protein